MDVSGFQTPAIQSGVSSPFYSHSRSGSQDNLPSIAQNATITPAALSSRLANVSLDPSNRHISSGASLPSHSPSGRVSPSTGAHGSVPRSETHSTHLTRSNSEEEDHSDRHSTEHVDLDPAELAELSRVPSYATAVKTPARSRTMPAGGYVPDYQTALHAPRTPPATDISAEQAQLGPIPEEQRRSGPPRSSGVPSSLAMTAADSE